MTIDIPIQIANMTSPVIVRAEDPWSPLTIATILLTIITFILVVVTYFGNKWTNENTKKSNQMLELELKS
ncbi:MAG: hypothetical protein KGL95_06495, partial [Patescibacteria group bacterium]|nr:hypothetical protein [Patescibacteria group bacterium]